MLILKAFPKINCPTCGKKGDWLSQPFGPFCSRRCKLIDLGKWLNEEHVISEPLPNVDLNNPPDNQKRTPLTETHSEELNDSAS